MDNLKKSAVAFLALSNLEYRIKLMRRGDGDVKIILRLEETNFYHLAGIQHVQQDIPILKNKTKLEIFHLCLSGEIKEADLLTSPGYNEYVKDRLAHLPFLEEMIDSAINFIDFDPSLLPFPTDIPSCKTLCFHTRNGDIIYLFIDEDPKTHLDYPLSFFKMTPRRFYNSNQIKRHLRLKIKTDLSVKPHSPQVLYQHGLVTQDEIDEFCKR